MLSFEPFEGRFVRDGFSRVLFWLVLDLGVDAAMYVGASIENILELMLLCTWALVLKMYMLSGCIYLLSLVGLYIIKTRWILGRDK
ncbi:uncharacterized protein LOC142180342 isoform X3 [Nicotiana tabacum]|uniref:Uncharacterized protein LOC142180342 isoform X3 n=1 Tax=Nicotiana tabacum TaxID=4097 RepID=A0AC58UFJ7_TOBAC